MTPESMTPQELFEGFDPRIEEICNALRSIVRPLLPDAEERVQVGWSVVSYSYSRMCVLISPREKVVRLMLDPRGEDLEDPGQILEETGRRFMHVEYTDPSQIDEKLIIPAILDAARLGGRDE